jgi:hypothetical protein
MYYCLRCQMLHEKQQQVNEMVFTTGFVYWQETKYPAGTCQVIESELHEDIQDSA